MDALYVLYNDVINSLSNFLYTYILIILLVAGGIYFTVRTRFVQFRYLLESIRVVMQAQPRPGQCIRLSDADGVHRLPRGHGQHCRHLHRHLHRRNGGRILDVGHRPSGQRHRVYRGDA